MFYVTKTLGNDIKENVGQFESLEIAYQVIKRYELEAENIPPQFFARDMSEWGEIKGADGSMLYYLGHDELQYMAKEGEYPSDQDLWSN